MRVRLSARAFVVGTSAGGALVLAAAAARAEHLHPAALALLAAGVVLAELFQVPSDDESLDPVDAQTFSFSSGIHVAAILVVGPASAALVAAFGVLAVDRLRGHQWRRVLFNASVFALATAAAGVAFELAGGRAGSLSLPRDLPALAALFVTYRLINLGLVSAAISLSSGVGLWPLFREELAMEVGASAAEAGLGVAVAFAALTEPWLLVALAPLGLAVYHAHFRLTLLRRETLRALETFANVVDERDPHTFHHSERVAEHVRKLAEKAGLGAGATARLRLAARLHDLGKIAVDGPVLQKPDQLNVAEWKAMRRHARLSARLLRRFRFAQEEAVLVEYHHERFDGEGYYGIDPRLIPLAAHFLIVADSFDAMTSDRSYRAALSRDEALARIEEASGSQFHPLVARAFVAVERGEALEDVLTQDELRELKRITVKPERQPVRTRLRMIDRPGAAFIGGLLGALVCLGCGLVVGAVAFGVLAAGGATMRIVEGIRARRFESRLRGALAQSTSREAHFHGLAGRLAASSGLCWAGLVSWQAAELTGAIELEASEGAAGPTETALVSWLLRETETREDVIAAAEAELGVEGRFAAIPLRRGDAIEAYLVLGFDRSLSRSVELALRACIGELSAVLLGPDRTALAAVRRPLAAVS